MRDRAKQFSIRLFTACCLTWASPALAQAQVSLDEAVTLALKHAPEIRAARQGVAAADARIGQARAAYWPGAGLEVKYMARWPKTELPIDLSGLEQALPPGAAPEIGDIDDVHHFSAGLRLGYRVFDLSRGPRVDAARHARATAQAGLRQADAAVAFRARATFIAALLARDLEALARVSLKVAADDLARARVAESLGSSSRLGLAQAKVRVAQLQARLTTASSEQHRLRLQLASLLGQASPPTLKGDLAELARRGPTRGKPSSKANGDRSPALEALLNRRRAALAMETSLSRAFWPTVSVAGQAEVTYPHAMKLEWGPSLSAGVNLEWRLFDGFLRSSRQAEQRAVGKGLHRQAQAETQGLERSLNDLAAQRQGAAADLASAREVERQGELQLSVARAAAASGAATHLDRQAAEVALDRARAGVSQAQARLCLISAEELRVRGVSRAPGIDSVARAESHEPTGGNR